MRYLVSVFVVALLPASLTAQVVTTEPAMPTDDLPVNIIFHADEGNKGLMNYSGDDVYAHTGVITDKSASSSNWLHIKADWTVNLPECKLSKVSANEYQLIISSSIREFYHVPEDEKILKMAFVFKNSNQSKTGRNTSNADIFVDVFEQGLQVDFQYPSNRYKVVRKGQSLPVKITSVLADSLFLFDNNNLLKKTDQSVIDTSVFLNDNRLHLLVAIGKNNSVSRSDTFACIAPKYITENLSSAIPDGINYMAPDSAIFVLFAPGKDNAYLLGDFNKWLPDSIYELKKDGDRFWLPIGNLEPDKEYAFQYLVDDSILIADPYTEKILDPAHDGSVPYSVYRPTISYPSNKTNNIVGVIHPGKPSFNWNEADYAAPASSDLMVYELLVRDFVESHDIKDITDSLNYLLNLGINAIELMPFNEFEENSSWGYNPSFYFATDKYYGSDNDFKNFINECHKRGIAVIMDIVLNHSYGQSPMVQLYFNPSANRPSADNPWFNEVSPNSTFSWGFDFNHEAPATQNFVDRVIKYWLTEFHIDGFRFDFTKGFTNTPGDGMWYDESRITLLKRIYDKIQEIKPGAYMICEHLAPNNEEQVLADYGLLLWGNGNYNYNEATMGYVENSDLSWHSYQSRGWESPNLLSYMESHDEERLMFKNLNYGNSFGSYNIRDTATALARMELAGAFFFTIPGPKMIWQFGELGYDYPLNYLNNKLGEKPVRWDYLNNENRKHLYLVWSKLIDLRKKYPVFNTNDYTLTVGNNANIKKIELRHQDGNVVVIGNFGIIKEAIQPVFNESGLWYEVFSGDSVQVSDISMQVVLNPGEYRIYSRLKMKSEISGINTIIEEPINVFPNPVNDILYIRSGTNYTSASVYNAAGNFIGNRNIGNDGSIQVQDLPDGLYFIKVQSGRATIVSKFIKN